MPADNVTATDFLTPTLSAAYKAYKDAFYRSLVYEPSVKGRSWRAYFADIYVLYIMFFPTCSYRGITFTIKHSSTR
jgi:hypothetical protein